MQLTEIAINYFYSPTILIPNIDIARPHGCGLAVATTVCLNRQTLSENIGFPVFISSYLYNYWSHESIILSRVASLNCELYHMFFSQNILFIFKLSQTGLHGFHILTRDGAFNSAFFDKFIDSSDQ